jgi:hypothetical protein
VSLELNGRPVEGNRLSNRPMRASILRGSEHTFVTPDGAVTPYFAPSYEAVKKDFLYCLMDGVNGYEYEFNVSDLLKEGGNTLVFRSRVPPAPDLDYVAHVDDVELRIRAKTPPPPPPKPAPTGEIPCAEPQTAFPKTYSDLASTPASIDFAVKGERLSVNSRFSTPDGRWQTGSNAFFQLDRRVLEHDEWIEVRDTFKNLTEEDLPIIQRHACDLGKRLKGAWLGGVEIPSGTGNRAECENPSAFATTDTIGLGLLPLNDEFLVHVKQSAADGTLAVSDDEFYLGPGGEYTAEWAIVPVTEPDFWAFVNAGRRLRDVNFTLKYCFAFMFRDPPGYPWPDETCRRWLDNKGVNFLVKSNDGVLTKKGFPARCTDWIAGPHTVYKDFVKRVHRLYPKGDVKTGIYFHCYLDTHDANAERFKDDRLLNAAGHHVAYAGYEAHMKYFIPTLDKGHWGEEIGKVVDVILNDIGADGVYWDEFAYSSARYAYNRLDNCSADIDPKTFKIQRKKGALTLLSRDFRCHYVKRILDEGRPFIINGAPVTRTIGRLKFQAFCETGTMTYCRRMLLYSPVALGDHLTERKYQDSYRNIHAALDHGCLFVWYTFTFHNHKAPTAYMFPFTPIELHTGYVIGQERIVTRLSGYFGWADNSDFESHVFDGEGKETDSIKIGKVMRDGRSLAEVRLPEGCMAILVRIKK